MTSVSKRSVTVLVPTNGRPQSLKRCLRAVRSQIGQEVGVIVLDSTPAETHSKVLTEYSQIYAKQTNIDVISFSTSVPPGHARKILAKSCPSPFMLFMDDDHEIQPGCFEILTQAMEEHNLDIVSGRWIDTGGERPLGFIYTEGNAATGKAIVKLPIRYTPDYRNTIIQVDDVLATMLCRKSIFERVTFDERFDFFYELFDFFQSCRLAGIRIGVAADAVFLHKPTAYRAVSTRQTQQRARDEARFRDKWGMSPIVPSLTPPSRNNIFKSALKHFLKNF